MGRDRIKKEIDTWDARRMQLKQAYLNAGETEEVADAKSTDQVRREIRGEINNA
jgi:hypothetical protein